MAQHGYLREYDEGSDRDRERDQGREDWRERSEREWRGRDEDRSDRERGGGMMFGGRDRDRGQDRFREGEREDDGGFFSRIGDEARSWFREEGDQGRGGRSAYEGNRHWPRHREEGGRSGREQHGSGGWGQSQRQGGSGFSSHPDDHYRSWRDRQMQSLDRDYQDYCREREQQFHRDFDSWRQTRQQQPQGQQGAMSQQPSQGGSSNETLELSDPKINNPAAQTSEPQSSPDPMATATMGTNNSENSGPGRGRR
jgi:hypothetical protein